MTTIRSLQNCSRLSIRAALGTNIVGKVSQLHGILAPSLIDYILLPELDDITDKYIEDWYDYFSDSSDTDSNLGYINSAVYYGLYCDVYADYDEWTL